MDHLNYVVGHKASGLKVGDTVKIMRKAESHESGWKNSWVPEMDEFVGKTLTITHDGHINGFECGLWDYPFFVLEKVVSERIPTKPPRTRQTAPDPSRRPWIEPFKVGDKVLIEGAVRYLFKDGYVQIMLISGDGVTHHISLAPHQLKLSTNVQPGETTKP